MQAPTEEELKKLDEINLAWLLQQISLGNIARGFWKVAGAVNKCVQTQKSEINKCMEDDEDVDDDIDDEIEAETEVVDDTEDTANAAETPDEGEASEEDEVEPEVEEEHKETRKERKRKRNTK